MASGREALHSFNRGVIDDLAIARLDVKRATVAASIQENFSARVLGPMMLRPGLQFIATTLTNGLAGGQSKLMPFVKSTTDTSLIEFSDGSVARVIVDDVVVTFAAVASAISNSNFNLGLAFWTVNDEAGATSTGPGFWLKQVSSNGFAAAIVDQTVVVAGADLNKEHALRIVVQRGPITFSVGSTTGNDDYIGAVELEDGTHILAFTPAGNFSVRVKAAKRYETRVDTVEVYNGFVRPLEIAHPFQGNYDHLRWDQSADVAFLACDGVSPRRLERRGARSYGLVTYKTEDGPFRVLNTGFTTIAPSDIDGDITLTASQSLFKLTHVGALFRLQSSGQKVSTTITAGNQFTNAIKVSGVGGARDFQFQIDGADPATGAIGSIVTLQVSFGVTGNWVDTGNVYTFTGIPATGIPNFITIHAEEDNTIQFLRVGVKAGDYTARTPTLTLTYANGSISGVARVTAFTSSTVVSAQVLKPLGGTTPVTLWSEGEWSTFRGYPSSVALHEGRLWWGGLTKVWASVSDAFNSFDQDFVGDAGPIARSIGSGPVDTVEWMVSLQRLLVGTQGSEHSLRSSAVDDPMTPTNFNIKPVSGQGSSPVAALKVDQSGVFVGRTGARAYWMQFAAQFFDYSTQDLTSLCPRLMSAGVVRMAVQRQPDTRIHFVLADGTAVVCVREQVEDVVCFETVTTDGNIVDVAVLPAAQGDIDDRVYYIVNRTINGAAAAYIEKFAQMADCQGGSLNMQADAFVSYTGAAAAVITGLSHLNGEQVVVWADGQDVGTDDSARPWTQRYTVAGGQITLAVAATNVVVGLGYTARFKSVKVGATVMPPGNVLNVQKRVPKLGLILQNVHSKGLQFGSDFDHLDDMPGIEDGAAVAPGVYAVRDEESMEFPGTWDADARVCLQAVAPRPVTVVSMVVSVRE